ncbi:hypothetical protein AB0M39_10405 [Streptomyces sp. NPDC051907]|uniref:toxin-antitoxin system YwqK family antitoxin n=1 Tax=Streptomyces sp. NPDC051907 TaxID=3155284 RepID=UPI00344B001A
MDSERRIDIDDPEVDMDGGGRLLYRGELFTGEVTEHLGTPLVSLNDYVEGVLHGLSREWYKDGTLRSEGTVQMGRAVGLFREWHPNGRLASERVFSQNGLPILAERVWDEQGNLTKSWKKEAE